MGRPDLVEETGHFQVWESEASAQAGLARVMASDVGAGARCGLITGEERDRLAAPVQGPAEGRGLFFDNTLRLNDPNQVVRALWAGFEKAEGRHDQRPRCAR